MDLFILKIYIYMYVFKESVDIESMALSDCQFLTYDNIELIIR